MKFSIFLFLIISLFSFSYEITRHQCEINKTRCQNACLKNWNNSRCLSQCQSNYFNCLNYATA